MAFDTKTQQKLIRLFEGTDYRKVVAEKTGVHPNTVANVLHNCTDNPTVELEILIYAQAIQVQKEEEDKKRKRAREIIKQL